MYCNALFISFQFFKVHSGNKSTMLHNTAQHSLTISCILLTWLNYSGNCNALSWETCVDNKLRIHNTEEGSSIKSKSLMEMTTILCWMLSNLLKACFTHEQSRTEQTLEQKWSISFFVLPAAFTISYTNLNKI